MKVEKKTIIPIEMTEPELFVLKIALEFYIEERSYLPKDSCYKTVERLLSRFKPLISGY